MRSGFALGKGSSVARDSTFRDDFYGEKRKACADVADKLRFALLQASRDVVVAQKNGIITALPILLSSFLGLDWLSSVLIMVVTSG